MYFKIGGNILLHFLAYLFAYLYYFALLEFPCGVLEEISAENLG